MRLEPIENPKSLLMKVAYWISKKQLGKVITPMKTIYARHPKIMFFTAEISKTSKKLTIDPTIGFMIKTYVAELNECSFCVDIGKALALDSKINIDKFYHLSAYKTSDLFSEKEKAALAFAEELTLTKNVSDAVYANALKYFPEKEIIEITWLVATEFYYNLMNHTFEIQEDGLCALREK